MSVTAQLKLAIMESISIFSKSIIMSGSNLPWGVVGWCEGVVYLTSPGRPTDIGLQFGKACYPCSR